MAEFVIENQPRVNEAALDFSAQDMDRLARQGVIRPILDRLAEGRGAFDQQMSPLSKKYRRRKQRLGKRPIRDWSLSGDMLDKMQVLDASENRLQVGVRGGRGPMKLAINQRRDRGMGLSPSDAATADRETEEIHRENLENAVEGQRR